MVGETVEVEPLHEPRMTPLSSGDGGEEGPDLSAVALAKADGRERGRFVDPIHSEKRKWALHEPYKALGQIRVAYAT